MKRHRMYGYGLLMVIGLAWLVGQQGEHALSAPHTGGLPDLEKRVAALEAKINSLQQTIDSQSTQIAALDARLVAVEAKTAPISVAGTAFTISGKNVFIQDGSGNTQSNSGLGNLTIGYNASRNIFPPGDELPDNRTGTHNLILGDFNNYSSFGGLVAGANNEISGMYASVSGRGSNGASGTFASVSGGIGNGASGHGATVSGGTASHAGGNALIEAEILAENQTSAVPFKN